MITESINHNNSIRVNPKLIEKAINQRFISKLSFYYLLKHTYKNSRVYNIMKPKERLSQLTGLSIPTINKYLDNLCYHNLLKADHGGWELITYKSTVRYKIKVSDKPTISEIKNLLFLNTLESEGKKQALYFSLKEFITNGNRGAKHSGKMKLEDTFKPRFSVRYIAKILNISQRTTIKIVKELNSMGVIKTESSDPEFLFNCGTEGLRHLDGLPGYRYYQSGAIFEIQPASHEFIQHPVKAKEMTLRKYKVLSRDPAIRKYIDGINQLSDY